MGDQINKAAQVLPSIALERLLQGGDLRSIGGSNLLAARIHTQQQFDVLFLLLQHTDRKIVMRAADAIEKVTSANPQFLQKHKTALLALCRQAQHKELQWHLAQLLPRLALTESELEIAWQQLCRWVHGQSSNIVRVNALQALADIQQQHAAYNQPFQQLLLQLENHKAPSLQVRLRKIRQTLS